MSTKYDEKIENILNELNILKKQQQRSKRFVVFMVVICLLLSGITGVASYSLGANQVGYTPKDTSWNVENTKTAIDELRDNVGASLVGSIFSYMGTTAPYGYLACDGTEYNIADYPRLANHINAHFGSTNYFGGDGETTFAVPDLRGEFLRGTGSNSHANQGSGESVGTHQDATDNIYMYTNTNWDLNYPYNTGPRNYDSLYGSARRTWNYDADPYGSNSYQYFTNRPTNTSVLYIIKY